MASLILTSVAGLMHAHEEIGNRTGLSVCVLSNVDVIELKANMTFKHNGNVRKV